MSSESWLDPLQATAAVYARAVLQTGENAGTGAIGLLSEALARIQALPEEAVAAVGELTAAVAVLFPEAASTAHLLIPSADPPSAEPCPGPSGQAGPVRVTMRPKPGPPARRGRIDAAGLARFLRAQHPHKPAEHASVRTGVPLDTVTKILKRETLPVGRTLLAFVVGYGPELLAAVLPDVDERWLEGARILADQARLEEELARTRAAMAINTGRWSFCGVSFGGGA